MRTLDYGRAILVDVEFDGDTLAPFNDEEIERWVKFADPDAAEVAAEITDLAQEMLSCSISERTVIAEFETYAAATKLPYGPVQEIEEVVQLNRGAENEITGYHVRGDTIYFAESSGADHPYYRAGLRVTYRAGYRQIPAGLKAGLRQAIATALSDRQDNVLGAASEIPTSSRKKLLKWRRY